MSTQSTHPRQALDLLAFRDRLSIPGTTACATPPGAGDNLPAAGLAGGVGAMTVKYSLDKPKRASIPTYGGTSAPVKYAIAAAKKERNPVHEEPAYHFMDISDELADGQAAIERLLGFDGACHVPGLAEIAHAEYEAFAPSAEHGQPGAGMPEAGVECAAPVTLTPAVEVLPEPDLAVSSPEVDGGQVIPVGADSGALSARPLRARLARLRRKKVEVEAAPIVEEHQRAATVAVTITAVEDSPSVPQPAQALQHSNLQARKGMGSRIAHALCNPPAVLRPVALYLAILPTVVAVNYGYDLTHDTLSTLSATQAENKKLRESIAALQKQVPAAAPTAVAAAPTPVIENPVIDRPVLPLPMASSQPNERLAAPPRVLRASMPAPTKVNPIDLTVDEPIAEKSDIPAAGKFTYISQDNKPAPSKFKLIEGK